MRYVKELDALRGIAILFVIITHWAPPGLFKRDFHFGEWGVFIFFVLSGYLITHILFSNINKGKSTKEIIISFYIRRTLRIFPIYYLAIGVLWLCKSVVGKEVQEGLPWFLTYTQNIYYFINQNLAGPLSPYWTLAVEEQFYLIWPWIIVMAGSKRSLVAIIIFLLVGFSCFYIIPAKPFITILTPFTFFSFGLGGLLAWLQLFQYQSLVKFLKSIQIIGLLSVVLFFLGVFKNNQFILPINILISITAFALIAYLLIKKDKLPPYLAFVFTNKFLIFTGKISYGIYLYHNLIPQLLNSKLVNIYFNPLLPDFLYKHHWGLLYLVENVLLLYGIAWLSYWFIEKRFLALKEKFS
ncbi:MAG: acyltransferase family protein [Chitinophagaceae bacterium]